LTDARFRKSQRGDGGWSYMPSLADMPKYGVSTPSMTCAGLVGLAMGHGIAILRTDPRLEVARTVRLKALANDPGVKAGLLALGNTIGRPAQRAPDNDSVGPTPARDISVDYYFLWSLERVAVAYGLTTIANKDWYAWGSELLVSVQQPDGSWKGKYGAEIDSSFALLFLRRSNLIRELTAELKGRVTDPGLAILRTSEKPERPKQKRQ